MCKQSHWYIEWCDSSFYSHDNTSRLIVDPSRAMRMKYTVTKVPQKAELFIIVAANRIRTNAKKICQPTTVVGVDVNPIMAYHLSQEEGTLSNLSCRANAVQIRLGEFIHAGAKR